MKTSNVYPRLLIRRRLKLVSRDHSLFIKRSKIYEEIIRNFLNALFIPSLISGKWQELDKFKLTKIIYMHRK